MKYHKCNNKYNKKKDKMRLTITNYNKKRYFISLFNLLLCTINLMYKYTYITSLTCLTKNTKNQKDLLIVDKN